MPFESGLIYHDPCTPPLRTHPVQGDTVNQVILPGSVGTDPGTYPGPSGKSTVRTFSKPDKLQAVKGKDSSTCHWVTVILGMSWSQANQETTWNRQPVTFTKCFVAIWESVTSAWGGGTTTHAHTGPDIPHRRTRWSLPSEWRDSASPARQSQTVACHPPAAAALPGRWSLWQHGAPLWPSGSPVWPSELPAEPVRERTVRPQAMSGSP